MSSEHASSRRRAITVAAVTGALLLGAIGLAQLGSNGTPLAVGDTLGDDVQTVDSGALDSLESVTENGAENGSENGAETTLDADASFADTLPGALPGTLPGESSSTTSLDVSGTEVSTTAATASSTTPAIVTTTLPGSTTAAPSTTSPATTSSPTATVPPTTTTPGQKPCPAKDGSSTRVVSFAAAPPMCINKLARYTAQINTSEGTISVSLDAKNYPLTVNNFVYLSRYHFYDGLTFHRVIPEFIAQGGSPGGTDSGNPGYEFADELPKKKGYPIGSLAMANGRPARPNTNGSQFFIVIGSLGAEVAPDFPLFGKVTNGTSVLKKIESLGVKDDPTGAPSGVIAIESITITAQGE